MLKKNITLIVSLLTLVHLPLNAMEDSDSCDWVLIHDETEQVQELLEQKKWVLKWATKHGHSKVIKKLLDKSSHEKKLNKTKKKFIQKHGKKYAFESAILEGNLNLVKKVLADNDDQVFIADTFSLAAYNGKKKITEYLGQENPKLFNNNTLYVLYQLFLQSITDGSLRPIKIVFNSSLDIEEKQWMLLINFGIRKAEKMQFIRCYDYLHSKKKNITKASDDQYAEKVIFATL